MITIEDILKAKEMLEKQDITNDLYLRLYNIPPINITNHWLIWLHTNEINVS